MPLFDALHNNQYRGFAPLSSPKLIDLTQFVPANRGLVDSPLIGYDPVESTTQHQAMGLNIHSQNQNIENQINLLKNKVSTGAVSASDVQQEYSILNAKLMQQKNFESAYKKQQEQIAKEVDEYNTKVRSTGFQSSAIINNGTGYIDLRKIKGGNKYITDTALVDLRTFNELQSQDDKLVFNPKAIADYGDNISNIDQYTGYDKNTNFPIISDVHNLVLPSESKENYYARIDDFKKSLGEIKRGTSNVFGNLNQSNVIDGYNAIVTSSKSGFSDSLYASNVANVNNAFSTLVFNPDAETARFLDQDYYTKVKDSDGGFNFTGIDLNPSDVASFGEAGYLPTFLSNNESENNPDSFFSFTSTYKRSNGKIQVIENGKERDFDETKDNFRDLMTQGKIALRSKTLSEIESDKDIYRIMRVRDDLDPVKSVSAIKTKRINIKSSGAGSGTRREKVKYNQAQRLWLQNIGGTPGINIESSTGSVLIPSFGKTMTGAGMEDFNNFAVGNSLRGFSQEQKLSKDNNKNYLPMSIGSSTFDMNMLFDAMNKEGGSENDVIIANIESITSGASAMPAVTFKEMFTDNYSKLVNVDKNGLQSTTGMLNDLNNIVNNLNHSENKMMKSLVDLADIIKNSNGDINKLYDNIRDIDDTFNDNIEILFNKDGTLSDVFVNHFNLGRTVEEERQLVYDINNNYSNNIAYMIGVINTLKDNLDQLDDPYTILNNNTISESRNTNDKQYEAYLMPSEYLLSINDSSLNYLSRGKQYFNDVEGDIEVAPANVNGYIAVRKDSPSFETIIKQLKTKNDDSPNYRYLTEREISKALRNRDDDDAKYFENKFELFEGFKGGFSETASEQKMSQKGLGHYDNKEGRFIPNNEYIFIKATFPADVNRAYQDELKPTTSRTIESNKNIIK